MLYVIYRQDIDIDNLVTTDIKDVIERATEIMDANDLDDNNFSVQLYNMDVDDYMHSEYVKAQQTYTLHQFVDTAKYPEEVISKIPMANASAFHHLDDDQTREVLKFTSDYLLFEELNRRITEYRSAVDKITEAMDLMKIFK